MSDAVIEALAALEHEQWMSWSKHIEKVEAISPKTYKRWVALWVPYNQLTEEMKDHDRVWARKVLKITENPEIAPEHFYAECVRRTGDS